MLLRSLLALTVIGVCVNMAAAQATTYNLTGENTKVEFVGAKKDGKHTGGFKKLEGTATVKDAKDPSTLSMSAVIDTTSLFSDNGMLTTHLKTADFFEVKKFPEAKFVSSKVSKTKMGYIIDGELTLHGKTNKVSIPAEVTIGDTLKISGKFTIDRTAYGITYGKGMIDNDVAITLTIEAKK